MQEWTKKCLTCCQAEDHFNTSYSRKQRQSQEPLVIVNLSSRQILGKNGGIANFCASSIEEPGRAVCFTAGL
jgi:hypothetical protein